MVANEQSAVLPALTRLAKFQKKTSCVSTDEMSQVATVH